MTDPRCCTRCVARRDQPATAAEEEVWAAGAGEVRAGLRDGHVPAGEA